MNRLGLKIVAAGFALGVALLVFHSNCANVHQATAVGNPKNQPTNRKPVSQIACEAFARCLPTDCQNRVQKNPGLPSALGAMQSSTLQVWESSETSGITQADDSVILKCFDSVAPDFCNQSWSLEGWELSTALANSLKCKNTLQQTSAQFDLTPIPFSTLHAISLYENGGFSGIAVTNFLNEEQALVLMPDGSTSGELKIPAPNYLVSVPELSNLFGAISDIHNSQARLKWYDFTGSEIGSRTVEVYSATYPAQASFLDVDKDGYLDWVMGHGGQNQVTVYFGNSTCPACGTERADLRLPGTPDASPIQIFECSLDDSRVCAYKTGDHTVFGLSLDASRNLKIGSTRIAAADTLLISELPSQIQIEASTNGQVRQWPGGQLVFDAKGLQTKSLFVGKDEAGSDRLVVDYQFSNQIRVLDRLPNQTWSERIYYLPNTVMGTTPIWDEKVLTEILVHFVNGREIRVIHL